MGAARAGERAAVDAEDIDRGVHHGDVAGELGGFKVGEPAVHEERVRGLVLEQREGLGAAEASCTRQRRPVRLSRSRCRSAASALARTTSLSVPLAVAFMLLSLCFFDPDSYAVDPLDHFQ